MRSFFDPHPPSAPASLVSICTSDYSSTPSGDSSYADYLSLESAGGSVDGRVARRRRGRARRRCRRADPGDARVRRADHARPARRCGRMLASADVNGESPTAVISHSLWRRAFASDGTVVGSDSRGRPVSHHRRRRAATVPGPRTRARIRLVDSACAPPAASAEERAIAGCRSSRACGLVSRSPRRRRRFRPSPIVSHRSTPRRTSNRRERAAAAMFVLPHARIHPQFRGDVVMLTGVIAGGGDAGPPDCVRERRGSSGLACDGPRPRDGDSSRARRRPGRTAAPAADRKP